MKIQNIFSFKSKKKKNYIFCEIVLFLFQLFKLQCGQKLKGENPPLDAENPTILSPPQCQKSHTFWTKNPTFWGIFFENLTPPTIFIAFLCMNFFQILKKKYLKMWDFLSKNCGIFGIEGGTKLWDFQHQGGDFRPLTSGHTDNLLSKCDQN